MHSETLTIIFWLGQLQISSQIQWRLHQKYFRDIKGRGFKDINLGEVSHLSAAGRVHDGDQVAGRAGAPGRRGPRRHFPVFVSLSLRLCSQIHFLVTFFALVNFDFYPSTSAILFFLRPPFREVAGKFLGSGFLSAICGTVCSNIEVVPELFGLNVWLF